MVMFELLTQTGVIIHTKYMYTHTNRFCNAREAVTVAV